MENDKAFERFRQQAEDFICHILPNSPSSSTQYTQGNSIAHSQISLLDSAIALVLIFISSSISTYGGYLASHLRSRSREFTFVKIPAMKQPNESLNCKIRPEAALKNFELLMCDAA